MNLTEQQKKISYQNWKNTWALFGYPTKESHKGLCLHHIDTTLRHENIERYIEWRPDDVVIMTMSEHTIYHNQFKSYEYTEDHKENLSKSIQETYDNGRVPAAQNKHWFNNGKIETYAFECPDGFIKGRLSGRGGSSKGSRLNRKWYNNGDTEVWAIECPEGFVKGRLKLKRYAEHTQKQSSKVCELQDKKLAG